jgi:hypothetical protein
MCGERDFLILWRPRAISHRLPPSALMRPPQVYPPQPMPSMGAGASSCSEGHESTASVCQLPFPILFGSPMVQITEAKSIGVSIEILVECRCSDN